jgi:hypothetical protein
LRLLIRFPRGVSLFPRMKTISDIYSHITIHFLLCLLSNVSFIFGNSPYLCLQALWRVRYAQLPIFDYFRCRIALYICFTAERNLTFPVSYSDLSV